MPPLENGAGIHELCDRIEVASRDEQDWVSRLSAGLRSGLHFLAADPPLAHRLLVEPLAAAGSDRLERGRTLGRLAQALRRPPVGGGAVSEETASLLAAGLVSYLSGRVLAGEAERLPESHDLLLQYLLTPLFRAASRDVGERRVAHA
jgi:AcrR family transcriptional regulator